MDGIHDDQIAFKFDSRISLLGDFIRPHVPVFNYFLLPFLVPDGALDA